MGNLKYTFKELFDIWTSCCLSILSGKYNNEKAKILDTLFLVDRIVDGWIESLVNPTKNKKHVVKKEIIESIQNSGFLNTASLYPIKDYVESLKSLLFSPKNLESLHFDILSAEKKSKFWAERLLDNGSLIEIRIFDIQNKKQIVGVIQSPIETRILHDKLLINITTKNLGKTNGYCALLPLGIDNTFTREPIINFHKKTKTKKNKSPLPSKKEWNSIVKKYKKIYTFTEFCVEKDGVIKFEFNNIHSVEDLANRQLLVLILD